MHKLIRSAVAIAAVGALATTLPTSAEAQGSATGSIQATATVSTGLAIAPLRNLDFGTVFPGLSSTVLETDATSGHLRVLGGAGAEVAVTFPSLPTTLDDGFGNSMSVTFTATHNISDQNGSGTSFVPSTGVTTSLDGGTGELHVYVGGNVTAGDPQAAGNYSALVTMNAAYTGN
jgi:hypothetical protein